MVDGLATSSSLPAIVHFAKAHNWRIAIKDPYRPPINWTGDGVMLQALDLPESIRCIRRFNKLGIPVLQMLPRIPKVKMVSISPDYREAGRIAAKHFAERRFSRIAWFSLEWTNLHNHIWEGFIESWSGDPPEKWSWMDDARANQFDDYKAIMSWVEKKLQKAVKPIGILAFNTYNAMHVLEACEALGLSVPDDVAILAARDDNQVFAELQNVPLSGIDFEIEKTTQLALEAMEKLLAGENVPDVAIPPSGVRIRKSTNTMATDNPFLQKIYTLIRKNLTLPYGAAQISMDLGLPRSTLDLKASQALGHSLGEEIINIRLAEAKQLLMGSELKLETIARQTGFCNAAYLIKTFKKKTGFTPRQWQEKRD